MTKGQVSTEYLVILAVVLVIALVVVFLVSQGTDVGTGVTESQSKLYWSGVAPLSVTGYQVSGTTVTLEITNRDAERITLTAIDVDSSAAYTNSTAFAAGETRTIAIAGALSTACTAGSRFSHDVDFTYNRGGLTGLTQKGERPIVGTC